jgi:glutathione S-transferase
MKPEGCALGCSLRSIRLGEGGAKSLRRINFWPQRSQGLGLRLLCRTFKQGPFASLTNEAYFQADQWADWLATALYYPAFRQYYLYQTKIPAAEKDASKLAAYREEALGPLRFLNDQLATRDYVASHQFSIADLLAGVYVDRWMRLDAEASSLAHIARYFVRLSQREPYKKLFWPLR